ncbi:MAG: M48 family metallopeptidase, partial [Candidatus Diapherotrites archaeon]|nr:M48 family metallopeptidase [Candidatus Diapherotrites archaeon]
SALFGYYYSDKIVLSISQARPATKEENTYLVNTVEGLSLAAGIPMPQIYVIDDTALNAFATGRDPEHSIICVTSGLLKTLNRSELEGVIAHEMSHIKNYDIRLMMLATVFVGTIALLSDLFLRSLFWGGGRNREENRGGIILIVIGILLAILAPFVAILLKLAVSRQREYLADASGVELTRNPPGLASALRKISGDKEILEAANKATAHLYICNPLHERAAFMDSLFATHPPIAERIKRIEEMGG